VTAQPGPARRWPARRAAAALVAAAAAALALASLRDWRAPDPAPPPTPPSAEAGSPPAPDRAPARRWRERGRPPAEVPAGMLARVASRSGVAVDRGPACPPVDPKSGPPPDAIPEATSPGAGCTPSEEVLDVEMDWHAPPGPR